MRKRAWILTMAFCLLSAISDSGMLQSIGKETPTSDPPACPSKFDDGPETVEIPRGIGGIPRGVTPPKPMNSPPASFSKTARKEFRKQHLDSAASFVSLVVGVAGIPHDVCLVKAAGYDLDAKAAEAVLKYKFKPAMKDGEAVPARLTIEVKFRLY